MNTIVKNYNADKAGFKTVVLGKTDFETVKDFTEYKESVQSYFNTLAHFKKVNALHKTRELNDSLRAVLVASKQLDMDDINKVMPFNIHSFLIGTTKTTAKGYTDDGKTAVDALNERIKALEIAIETDKPIKNESETAILSTDAMQTELETKKAELSALKDTAIYNATNIKQTSVNTFRRRLELVVGSCLADNGKMLTDFEDVQNIQLGKKWRTFKANFEKYELDMTVFWDCVAKKYHQHDDKAENIVKDMIATAKKAEKEKAENPQAEKPTAEELQGMVIAELKKLATDKGLTVPKKAKKADIISIIKNAA